MAKENRDIYLVAAFDGDIASQIASSGRSAWMSNEAFRWIMDYSSVIRASSYGTRWTKFVKLNNFRKNRRIYRCTNCKEAFASKHNTIIAHHIYNLPYILHDFIDFIYSKYAEVDGAIFMRELITYKPFWDLDNGIVLCVPCHNKHHDRRADFGVKRTKRVKIVGYNS